MHFLKLIHNTIQLSGPKTDLYVGQHVGIITYYDEDEIMYQEEFQVLITSPVSSAPYFINLEPPKDYDF